MYDMTCYDHNENDFLIMASDGLWDVTSNEKAALIVHNCLMQFEPNDRSRSVICLLFVVNSNILQHWLILACTFFIMYNKLLAMFYIVYFQVYLGITRTSHECTWVTEERLAYL